MRGTSLVLLLCGFVFACATPVVARGTDPRSIPLVDQTGTRFRLSDLRGRPTILTFVASRCTDACPIANVEFDRMRTSLERDGVDARLVTVTLDPGYDTPVVMNALARSFNADSREWIFASGRVTDVRGLMRSLGIVARVGKAGYPDEHTTMVYVLDAKQRLSHELLLSTGISMEVERALSRKTAPRGFAHVRE
jgi:cytochrome oxidase Cu insertion factor (SCO1/SenC/PrrC family)